MVTTKKDATPAAITAPEVKTGELVAKGETALGAPLPDFITADIGSSAGIEDMAREDMKMPRLAIAQGLSPQLLEAKPEYLPELRIGELFNTLTGEIYGKGPLEFAVVQRIPPRWIEFDADRNLVDPNVPVGDSRTLWRTNEKGERQAPVATQFYDFIIVLLDNMQPIALSCARTAINAAKTLNGLIQFRMPRIPLCAGRYTVHTKSETNDKGTYGVYVIKNAGVVQAEGQYLMLKQMMKSFQHRVINIDREATPTVEDAGQTVAAGSAPSGGDIPF